MRLAALLCHSPNYMSFPSLSLKSLPPLKVLKALLALKGLKGFERDLKETQKKGRWKLCDSYYLRRMKRCRAANHARCAGWLILVRKHAAFLQRDRHRQQIFEEKPDPGLRCYVKVCNYSDYR